MVLDRILLTLSKKLFQVECRHEFNDVVPYKKALGGFMPGYGGNALRYQCWIPGRVNS